MRASEFITEAGITYQYRDTPFTIDQFTKTAHLRRGTTAGYSVPSGWYSRTAVPKQGAVTKSSHQTSILSKDAYFAYVKATLNMDNPYFPRIESIRVAKDRKGNERPFYKIERLEPHDNLTKAQLTKLIFSAVDRNKFTNLDLKSNSNMWTKFMNILERAAHEEDYTDIIDPQLQQALELIGSVKRAGSGYSYDLHAGNAMIRGGKKPHIVITDPLSDGGQSLPTVRDIAYGPGRHSERPTPDEVERARASVQRRGIQPRTSQPRTKGDHEVQVINRQTGEILDVIIVPYDKSKWLDPQYEFYNWLERHGYDEKDDRFTYRVR